MIIRRCTETQLRKALHEANERFQGNLVFLELEDRSGPRVPKFRVRLSVADTDEPGSRRSLHSYYMGWTAKPRKVKAACYHGYGQFLTELFGLVPDAIVETAQAHYRGAESFLEQFGSVAYKNIGSMMCPVQFDDACNCWDHDLAYIDTEFLRTQVYGDREVAWWTT